MLSRAFSDSRSQGGEIAVVGSGIAGLSAAWLLSQRHPVTVFEKNAQPGGHSNTVDAPAPRGVLPVDTAFMVYNEVNYPNLVALFRHLGVATQPADMSFAASLDDGRFEYSSLALLWQFRFDGVGEEFLTVRASPGWRPCEEVEDGLPDGRHARLWRRSPDSFFSVPLL